MEEKLIFVTGFDVFQGYFWIILIIKLSITKYFFFRHEEINASWEAVKILPDEITLPNKTKFSIIKRKVQVKYNDVDEIVKDIWAKENSPHLVIHVGVHGKAKKILLEKCAINEFCHPDYSSNILNNPKIKLNSRECDMLKTKFDVDKIVNFLNMKHEAIFNSSCDVGTYLCGYIYLKSLDIDNSRVLFIHVPSIDKISSERTSSAILKVIEQCLIARYSSLWFFYYFALIVALFSIVNL